MEYRKLPKGNESEKFSVLGLGLGSIHNSSVDEIEKIIRKAINEGINFFDLCASKSYVYAPFGRAIKDVRSKVFFEVHFGAVYNNEGDYGFSRDLNKIKETFEWELSELNTSYVDMGFLHCVDEENDYLEIMNNGIFDYLKELKKEGKVKHIGFSSHTPKVANMLLDTNMIDMMLFSINPAYDLEKGDEYGIGSTLERRELFQRCESQGIGISVMKPFHAGQLLTNEASPFKQSMSKFQLIKYALDRPGVLSVVPGIRNFDDLEELIPYKYATDSDKDYSVISEFVPVNAIGKCVYCNHCKPCPMNIDIGLVNKYYDLAKANDLLAISHYKKLTVNAKNCIECHHCDERCPFKVKQSKKMKEIAKFFSEK